ncbi:hypothetical protein QBC33DRAFT_445958 [Phialemonium atrogriseum]|uniref:Ribosomal protein bL31m N-terminal domain-containing protein n=1 Tax=Phialemonium atrogriseum TaxID=1093897 RepID=A0AAJ0C669_9PEZI|nr:uncharacterized protein QBC33DRAFT_445958 [Phialemonium atrogriseum]KAK1770710.1 hypothetical protein QBC33DRAFT_445958 [Phialemonium atrogriseum]
MGSRLPTTLLRRPSPISLIPNTTPTPSTSSAHHLRHHPTGSQVRHATFVPRHRRPYQFTQLVQLSDGSTFTHRTTSPVPLHRSTKDTRNHALWQPSEASLRNLEVDEAGKLAAFRARFGRGWDAIEEDAAAGDAVDAAAETGADAKKTTAEAAGEGGDEAGEDAGLSLSDLISGYAAREDSTGSGGLSAKEQAKMEKSGKKKR